jgi:subtilase-type serine protease
LVDPVGGIPLSVFKGGVGTWVLTNTNTYTGQTLILDGILRLTGALTNSTVVSSGGTLQGPATTGASCTVSGPVQISATAGVTSTFQPGTFGNNTFNTGALSFGGTLARATFNSTTNTFSKINVTGTCALGGMGCIFPAGITTNGTYDLIVASGTMSGTLPSIITNLTGKTLSLSKVGNTLKVTVS